MESNTPEFKPWGMDVKQYNLFMHLSQFAGYAVPLAGIVLPIVMWVTNKENDNSIDAHGKNIVNWVISSFIYAIVAGLLCLIFIGIPITIALFICMIVFPIIGAVKADKDEVYKYPMTFKFIK